MTTMTVNDSASSSASGGRIRTVVCVLLLACLCAALTGCGAETHVWQEATCTTPRTCTECGKMDGLPLGHDISGEANYQSAPVCSRCGEAIGEPLKGELESAGVKVNMVPGTEYDLEACCTSKTWHKTDGTVRVLTDTVFPSDADHPLIDGYEWHSVTAEAVFSDSRAEKYGVHLSLRLEDWYTPDLFDSSAAYDAASGFTKHTVSWYGEDAEVTERTQCVAHEWEDGTGDRFEITLEYSAPAGYDGISLAFFTPVKSDDEDLPLTELYNGKNLLLYRPYC